MAIYTNIASSGTATTLITKGSEVSGSIRKITISNNGPSPATIRLYLHNGDSTIFYICKDMIIPNGAILVLDDNLAFDSSVYNLKIELNNQYGTEDLTITIK